MKRLSHYWQPVWLLFLLILILIGCATVGGGPAASTLHGDSEHSVVVDNPNITLSEYLQRLSGVRVQGYRVFINGVNTFGDGYHPPLFIVDGVPVGRNFREIAGMNMHGVSSVEIIKDARTSLYGFQGGYGVIAIKTRVD